MGHISSQEALVLRWAELCADPRWHDLAGKIELNGRGVIEAPEICVEVRSPSNTDADMAPKTVLFLQAGAVEVWIVDEAGAQQVFDAQGLRPTSRFGVVLR